MIVARNAREALFFAAWDVLTRGEPNAPSSYAARQAGSATRELLHETIKVLDPTDWSCAGINAGWPPKIVALEAAQLVGGFSDPTLVERIAPSIMRYADPRTGKFDGAYGPRLARALPAAVARLQADDATRQAVIPLWLESDAVRATSRDFPCTLSIGFSLREGKLNQHVTMRSNDVNWGLKSDMGQFMILQCSVANVLGVEVGTYYHTAFSLHLYERDFEWARGIDGGVTLAELDGPRGGIEGRTIQEIMLRARLATAGRGACAVSRWLAEQLRA